MTDEKQQTIRRQVKTLSESIFPKLTEQERLTFEIRPSVTHGDIEIFVNGSMFFVSSEHLTKVEAAGSVEDYVLGILPKLRRKVYSGTVNDHKYGLDDVQNEIYYSLCLILDKILTPKEEDKLVEVRNAILKQVFGLESKPERYNAAQLQIINKLYREELVKLYNIERKNGGRK